MLIEERIIYHHGAVELEGALFSNAGAKRSAPGVLLVHEFMGPGDYMRPHAEALARLGYLVFAIDMYGRDVRPKDATEASRISRIYRNDRLLMRQRAMAGLAAFIGKTNVDASRISAMGFSFGGCTVLELARSGADLRGTASFYGYLNTPFKAAAGDIKGRVLALHGAGDKVVPMEQLNDFTQEMAAAGTDCQIKIHTGAGHGFSNRTVKADPKTGSAYCPVTAKRAWREAMTFLEEVIAGDQPLRSGQVIPA